MQLLSDELRLVIPKLYSQEKVRAQDKMVYAKFFFPVADWTWFVTEGEDEGDDFVFFGFVKGFEEEWGYFIHPQQAAKHQCRAFAGRERFIL